MPTFPRITSRQHETVGRFRQAARRSDGDVVLDGGHLLIEALDARIPVDTVLSTDVDAAVVRRARASGAAVYEVTAPVLDAASPVRTPSGIVALAHWRPTTVDAALAGKAPLVIGLCSVQDPGNVGSAIRAADALGATGVLAIDHTAHPGAWKVLRGGMGSTFRVPIARTSLDDALPAARTHGLSIIATVAAGGRPVSDIDWRAPTLVLLGSEGMGLPSTAIEAADRLCTIPMRSGAESLNVAVAAALMLYEARRQRERAGR